MKQSKKLLKSIAIWLVWLLIWQLAAVAVGQEILIPTPGATFSTLFKTVKTAPFWTAVFYSLGRILSGFLLGVVLGAAGGAASVRFPLFRAFVSPALHAIRAIPVASFIILALVWIQSTYLPIFISLLMILPMIWSSVESSLTAVDVQWIELAQVYRLSSFTQFFRIKVPAILPSFLSTAVTALGFAWKSGVAAEVIARPVHSLGGMLQDAKTYLETSEIFALTIVVVALSLILEYTVKAIVRRVMHDKA